MNTHNIEKKEHNIATFQVTVDAATFEDAVNKVYLRNKKNLYIPGFRKGKAPRQVIEGMYGSQVFYEEALDSYAESAFAFGTSEVDFRVVGAPSLVNVEITDDKEAVYTFEVAMYPEVQLGQYRGLEVPKNAAEFDESLVEQELENVRKRNARLLDVERPVQKGDRITLDFEGFIDGKPFDGGKAEDYDLEIGSDTFIPGFEDQLIGAEVGEARDIHVTFPLNYTAELAGKDATFKIVVKGVQEPELPELDDEFAKDISDFDTMEEYIDHVRTEQKKKFEDEQASEYAGRLMQTAIDNIEVDLPEPMILEKLDEQLRNYAVGMGMTGASKEQLLDAMQIDEATYQAVMRPQAEFEIKTELLLDAIVKAEGLEITDEEVEQAVQDMAGEYGMEAEQIKNYVNEDVMRTDLARRKAGEIIRETAVDKEPEPAEDEAPAAGEASAGEETPVAEEAPADEAKEAE